MPVSSRPHVLAATAVGALVLLAGCGNDASGARTTLVPVQPSSYVVQEPVPTTTTTTTIAQAAPEEGQISTVEQSYEIKPNDNLSKIASLFEVGMQDICNYNEWTDCIDPPHLLLPGDTIKIPPNALVPGTGSGGTGDEVASPDAEPEVTEAPQGCSHTIEAGENPTRVADKYEITVEQLREANPGVIDTFIVGQTLVIPAGGAC